MYKVQALTRSSCCLWLRQQNPVLHEDLEWTCWTQGVSAQDVVLQPLSPTTSSSAQTRTSSSGPLSGGRRANLCKNSHPSILKLPQTKRAHTCYWLLSLRAITHQPCRLTASRGRDQSPRALRAFIFLTCCSPHPLLSDLFLAGIQPMLLFPLPATAQFLLQQTLKGLRGRISMQSPFIFKKKKINTLQNSKVCFLGREAPALNALLRL